MQRNERKSETSFQLIYAQILSASPRETGGETIRGRRPPAEGPRVRGARWNLTPLSDERGGHTHGARRIQKCGAASDRLNANPQRRQVTA